MGQRNGATHFIQMSVVVVKMMAFRGGVRVSFSTHTQD